LLRRTKGVGREAVDRLARLGGELNLDSRDRRSVFATVTRSKRED
jgi:hypothetical protein